jgi:hypothetical protein
MLSSPASGPRLTRRSRRAAEDPQGRRPVSPNSPSYYLGIPAHVWADVMSRRNASPRTELKKIA